MKYKVMMIIFCCFLVLLCGCSRLNNSGQSGVIGVSDGQGPDGTNSGTENDDPDTDVAPDVSEETENTDNDTDSDPGFDEALAKSEITELINSFGANGFICSCYDDVRDADLREVLYQVSSDDYSFEEIEAAFEAEGKELFTDASCMKRDDFDALMHKFTGCHMDEFSSKDDFDEKYYFSSLDAYCLQHGDTNYQPVECVSVEYDGELYSAYIQPEDGFSCFAIDTNGELTSGSGWLMTFRHAADGSWQIVSNTLVQG